MTRAEISGSQRAASRPSIVPGAERFRLWTGRSGRRWVFSRLTAADRDDLDGAVILIAGADGIAHRVGTAADLDLTHVALASVWVHWMAESEAERRHLVEDLGGRSPSPCLA